MRPTSSLVLVSVTLVVWGCARAAEPPAGEEERRPAVLEEEKTEGEDTAAEAEGEGEDGGKEGDEKEKEKPAVFQAAKPPYKPGEELTFSLRWSGWNAGRAILKVEETKRRAGGNETIKVCSVMQSNAFVSTFFKIDDKSWSLIDAEGGYCHVFDFDKREGGKHVIEHTECDYEQGTAEFTLTTVTKKGREVSEPVTVKLGGCVTDPVTAFFYYRLIPKVEVGDEFALPVLSGKKLYTISMKATGKAFIRLRSGGVVKAIHVEAARKGEGGTAPMTQSGSSIWIEEKTHVPLRITSNLKFGSITMYLVKVKNVEGLEKLTKEEIRQARKEGYR